MKTSKHIIVLLTMPSKTVKQAFILNKKHQLVETLGDAFDAKGDFLTEIRSKMKKYGVNGLASTDKKDLFIGEAPTLDEYIQILKANQ